MYPREKMTIAQSINLNSAGKSQNPPSVVCQRPATKPPILNQQAYTIYHSRKAELSFTKGVVNFAT